MIWTHVLDTGIEPFSNPVLRRASKSFHMHFWSQRKKMWTRLKHITNTNWHYHTHNPAAHTHHMILNYLTRRGALGEAPYRPTAASVHVHIFPCFTVAILEYFNVQYSWAKTTFHCLYGAMQAAIHPLFAYVRQAVFCVAICTCKRSMNS